MTKFSNENASACNDMAAGSREVTGQLAGDGPACVVIQPNRSLSPRGALVFFLTMVMVQSVIATGFIVVMNGWLVLPFAGLELSALGAALWWCMRENRYREVVQLSNGEVTVEKGYGKPEQAWRASATWAKVVLQTPSGPKGKNRLLLSSAGKHCELGRCLTDADKVALAGRLRGLVKQAAEGQYA